MINGVISSLFDSQKRLTWRRLAMCASLQAFAAYALLHGSLDAHTWAWFAGGIAGLYVGGDSGEKIAKLLASKNVPG
tara:strand:- start:53 stop:283 length:231 start_codon:yes stop_codon:yes gene_type:complete